MGEFIVVTAIIVGVIIMALKDWKESLRKIKRN